MSNPELTVVVPAYNEAGNIEEFFRRLLPILEANVASYEIIFAVDPSSDGTEQIILEEHARNPAIKLLRFSRRFGQPTATLAGIERSAGDAVVVMDVDLQDPPELLIEMLAKWRDGYDVVYAQRRKRTGETLVKRTIAKLGYAMINRFADVPIPRDTATFGFSIVESSTSSIASRRRTDSCVGSWPSSGSSRSRSSSTVPLDMPARATTTGSPAPCGSDSTVWSRFPRRC